MFQRRASPFQFGTDLHPDRLASHGRVERARAALLLGLATLGVAAASGLMLFAMLGGDAV